MSDETFEVELEPDTRELPAHVVTRVGIVNCQVCSTGTQEEALEWVRTNEPAGTQNNWQAIDYGAQPEMAPVRCDKNNGRVHYMFVC